MMTHDELRKKCYELECALGTSMKLNDMMKEALVKSSDYVEKLHNINMVFNKAIKEYVNTMDKSILMKCVEETTAIAKTFKKL